MLDRRDLLKAGFAGLTTLGLPGLGMASAGPADDWLFSAVDDAEGHKVLGYVPATGERFRIAVSERCHGGCRRPGHSQAVLFARRPGRSMHVIAPGERREVARDRGRHRPSLLWPRRVLAGRPLPLRQRQPHRRRRRPDPGLRCRKRLRPARRARSWRYRPPRTAPDARRRNPGGWPRRDPYRPRLWSGQAQSGRHGPGAVVGRPPPAARFASATSRAIIS